MQAFHSFHQDYFPIRSFSSFGQRRQLFYNLAMSTNDQSLQPEFVHAIEAEFARILDYYGIPWEYEPKTFVLERDEAGNVKEAFSPDFYLPNEDLFVELTTMRPKLITKKNRKIRRLQELYPEVNIKLFKRSDLRDLMIKYGLDEQAAAILGTEAQDTN